MNVQNFDQAQNPPSSYYMHPRENPARPWLMEQKLALMELSYEEMSKNKSEFVGVIQIPNYTHICKFTWVKTTTRVNGSLSYI